MPDISAEHEQCADRTDATWRCAEGIIVGLRRCSLEFAARELAQVSTRYGLDSYRIARALVRLAQEVDPESDSVATSVARYEWGALLARSDDRQHAQPLADLLS
jgi:hypothetical protein